MTRRPSSEKISIQNAAPFRWCAVRRRPEHERIYSLCRPALGTSLSFPGLGLELSLNREAVFIGPLTIYWYGIIVVTGIALGIWYAVWRAGQFGIDRDRITDVILYSVLAAIVGARLYYVAFSWDYYSAHPEEIIAVWKGGIAFYGGVIGALLCAAFLCRRWKLPLVRGHRCCARRPAAWAVDRPLGPILSTSRRLAGILKAHGGWSAPQLTVTFTFTLIAPGFSPEQVLSMSDIPVHPTFFYESAWTMLGFLFLVWYTKRRRFTGELTLFYFFWNGLGRAFIEGLRTDSLTFGSVRVSQLLAALMAAASVLLWLLARKRLKDGTAPVWMALGEIPPAPPLQTAAGTTAGQDAPGAEEKAPVQSSGGNAPAQRMTGMTRNGKKFFKAGKQRKIA